MWYKISRACSTPFLNNRQLRTKPASKWQIRRNVATWAPCPQSLETAGHCAHDKCQWHKLNAEGLPEHVTANCFSETFWMFCTIPLTFWALHVAFQQFSEHFTAVNKFLNILFGMARNSWKSYIKSSYVPVHISAATGTLRTHCS